MADRDEVLLTHAPLDVNAAFSSATLPSTGATSIFVGTTRDNFDGKVVLKLEYEAYEPMALKELKKLCDDIRSKWDVAKIVIQHRLGEVEITQPSVIIAISSPHRKESLEAVNYGIERLKEKVPIWKKEKYAEGGEVWKENKECCWVKPERRWTQVEIDATKVQVIASKEEIDRRIKAFIARKQEDKNKLNCLEFCNRKSVEDVNGWDGCARTVSTLSRKEGSKSHLRTSTVDNSIVPRGPYVKQQPKKRKADEMRNEPLTEVPSVTISEPLRSRFAGIENKLFQEDNKPLPRDVYSRLKSLEDRILLLESYSPEYSPIKPKSKPKANPQLPPRIPRLAPEPKAPELGSTVGLSPAPSRLGAVVELRTELERRERTENRRQVVSATLSTVEQRIQQLKHKMKEKYSK